MKVCTGCKKRLSKADFWRNLASKDGLNWRCKGCVRKYRRQLLAQPEARDKRRATAKKYYKNNRSRILNYVNSPEVKVKRRKYIKSHPEQRKAACRKYCLKKRYGLTVDAWQRLFINQGSCCAICHTADPGTQPWHTDHDHVAGKVRGILCHNCNHGLGAMKDSETILRLAADYVRKYNDDG